MRIPRKKKKLIPKGHPYCYDIVRRLTPEESEIGGFKIKPCPFYSGDLDGYCKLLQCGVDDQIKSCGIGY